jgi:hypothetical protein
MTQDNAMPYLTAAQYADAIAKNIRTVKRYLEDGERPGAVKDERGRWMIPANARRTEGAGELVTMTRPRTSPTTEMTSHPAGMIDAMPSFLTIDQAAQILGISRHAIATHREYFDVVPFGPNGSLVIPLATIKRIRG